MRGEKKESNKIIPVNCNNSEKYIGTFSSVSAKGWFSLDVRQKI